MADRQISEDIIARQRAWLRAVMNEHKIKPTRLARETGLAVTTLTRKYYDDDDTSILTDVNVGKIVSYLNIPPPNFLVGNGQQIMLREREAEPYIAEPSDPLAQAISALTAGKPGVDPVTLRGKSLEYAGYRPGDVLIIDQHATARAGDAVCAQVYDGRPHGAETIYRFFEPPFLVGAGDGASRKPLLVDDSRVKIMGVVVAALKRRSA